MRTASVIVWLTVIQFVPYSSAFGQATRCTAARVGPSEYRGECVRDGARVGALSLQPVPGRPPGLWRGSMLRLTDSLSIALDMRVDGALQFRRGWLTLLDASADSTAVRFGFSEDVPAPASQVDLDILRRARSYLNEPSRWNRADTTDMASGTVKAFLCAPTPKQSLFCALYMASMDVSGDYAHFRPAINAVRNALARVSNQQYRHPLVDFNNDPENDLRDMWSALDLAVELIQAQRPKQKV